MTRLPGEEEGITYYIRYVLRMTAYLQGTDCDGRATRGFHTRRHLETDRVPGGGGVDGAHGPTRTWPQ